MKRKSTVSYNANGNVITEPIWIQQCEAEAGSTVILELFEEEGKPVLTKDKKGTTQYQISIANGAYAYVSINAMKALLAMKRVKRLNNSKWVTLLIDYMVPSLEELETAEVVTSL